MNASQPNHHPDGSDVLDTLLAAAYTCLIDDLSATLDLDAGAAQATHPTTYSDLTHDLAQQLDLGAGLAAIITGGSLPPASDTQPHQPAPQQPAIGQAQDLERLRFLDAPARLALRAAPAFCSLRDALELGEFIARAQDLAKEDESLLIISLDRARALARALDPIRDLDPVRDLALARALDLARDRARALDLALDLAVARHLDRVLTRDLALTRARVLDLALAHDIALDIARDLDLHLARDLALALDLALTLARARVRARVRVRDLARLISEAFQLALAIAGGLTCFTASCYGRMLELRLDLGQADRLDLDAVTRARMALAEIGDDFVGADLRSAQMQPDIAGLEGVRWSNDTQWPLKWVDYVRAASEEIGNGLFRIATDGRRSPTYATT